VHPYIRPRRARDCRDLLRRSRARKPALDANSHVMLRAIQRADSANMARGLASHDAINATAARGRALIQRGAQYVNAIQRGENDYRAKLARIHDASTRVLPDAPRPHLELYPFERDAARRDMREQKIEDKNFAAEFNGLRQSRMMRAQLALADAVSGWKDADRSNFANALRAITGAQSAQKALAVSLLVDGFYPDERPAPDHIDGRAWRDARRKMRRADAEVQAIARKLAR
jgi:hypothetical protein